MVPYHVDSIRIRCWVSLGPVHTSKEVSQVAKNDPIESYWEDIRFYKPDPIIQLRAEDRFKAGLCREAGLSLEDVRHLSLDDLQTVVRAKQILRLAEQPRMVSPLDGLVAGGRTVSESEAALLNLNELQEVVRAIRPR